MADNSANYFSGGSEVLVSQSPMGATYFASASFSIAANIRYWQRVYDTGTAGWCYYSTVNALDPSPASGATTPNWTGSISDAQVLSAMVEP